MSHDVSAVDSDAAQRNRLWRERLRALPLVLALCTVLVYGLSYVTLRASHQLLCTGWFYNEVDSSGRHTSDAGWRDLSIRASSSDLGWVEAMYRPAILVECAWRRHFGGEPG